MSLAGFDALLGLIAGGSAAISISILGYAARRERRFRRRLAELAAAEERYRLAVEAAPSGLVMVNARGKIVLVNRELERLFGYERGELLGRDVEILVPERLAHVHGHYRQAYQQAPQERMMGRGRELSGRRKDGSEVPIEIGLTPIETAEGMHVLSAVVDLTHRKRIEGALANQAQELERSNAELEQFAYVASHDLQEPVRILRSYSEFLGQHYPDLLDDKGRKYLGYIVDGAEHMHQLINDLLLYSRAGRGELMCAELDANATVDGVIAMFGARLREQPGGRITRDDLPAVYAAETLLAQLFQNLIGNALKFRGAEPPQVHISCVEDGEAWRFAVRDNGIGIDPKHTERVFQLFQRLHERGKYPGTGIGLAIAKRIVERHGGRIWVESTPGAGSTFYFTLPRKQPLTGIAA